MANIVHFQFFGPTELKFLWQLRRLLSIDWSRGESKLSCLFSDFDILGRFLREIGSTGLRPQNPTKKLPSGWNFWFDCYLENIFSEMILEILCPLENMERGQCFLFQKIFLPKQKTTRKKQKKSNIILLFYFIFYLYFF